MYLQRWSVEGGKGGNPNRGHTFPAFPQEIMGGVSWLSATPKVGNHNPGKCHRPRLRGRPLPCALATTNRVPFGSIAPRTPPSGRGHADNLSWEVNARLRLRVFCQQPFPTWGPVAGPGGLQRLWAWPGVPWGLRRRCCPRSARPRPTSPLGGSQRAPSAGDGAEWLRPGRCHRTT